MKFGAQGTNYLGIPTHLLAAGLEDKFQNQQKSFADQQFEQQLAMSGMSPADQQMARMFRNAPAIAKVMADSRSREESQKWRAEDREDRQRQQEAMLKERQRIEDEQKKAALEAKKAEEAGLIAGAAGTRVTNYLTPKFAPTSAKQTGGGSLPIPSFMGMGGGNVSVPGQAEVPTMPDIAHDYLMKKDPSNPALQGVMRETDYKQRQLKQIAAQDAMRKQQGIADQKAAKERADEEERKRRTERSRAFLNREGFNATPEELALFDLATEGGKNAVDPFKQAEQIRKDRKTDEEKSKASRSKTVSEIEKAQIELADAKAKIADITISPEQKKALEEKKAILEGRIKRLQSGAAPKAPAAKPKPPPELIERMKKDLADPNTPADEKEEIRRILDQQVGKTEEIMSLDQWESMILPTKGV